MAKTPLTPLPPAKPAAAKKAAVKKPAAKKKATPAPVLAPKKGKNWAALVGAIALCATAIIMSQNDKEVSLAQIASAGKGAIPTIPPKGGNNVPVYGDHQQQATQPAAVAPQRSPTPNDGIKTVNLGYGDNLEWEKPGPNRPIIVCAAAPNGKNLFPAEGTTLTGGKPLNGGGVFLAKGECAISKLN